MSIQIVKYGTKVLIANGEIKAHITGVCIRDESISYEVSYFKNGTFVDIWIKRFQFEIDNSEKQKPGFVNYDKPDETNYLQLT